MPWIEDRPRTATARLTVPERLLGLGILGVILWGALSFGAVYAWAYIPLFIAASVTGAAALWTTRGVALPSALKPLLLALALVALGGMLQAIPLPQGVRVSISPATESFLRETNVAYSAAVVLRDEGHPLAATLPVPDHPLSISRAHTITAVLMLLSLMLFLAGTTALLGRVGAFRLASMLIVCGVLLAMLGIVQKAVLGDHAWGGMRIYGFWEPEVKLTTPFGPFVNKNHFAGWMVMALALAIGYFLAMADVALHRLRKEWRYRILWLSTPEGGRLLLVGFAVFVMGASLALTMSRSGILAFAAAAMGGSLFGIRGQRTWKARVTLLAVFIVLIAAPFVWSDVDLAERFQLRSDASIALRRDIWGDTVAVLRDFPLVGTGLNTFGTSMLKYQTGNGELWYREAHNDYLQVAAEGGLLVGIPALLALLFLLKGMRAALTSTPEDRIAYWVRFGAVMGVMAMGLQSIVEFSLQMPGNAVFFTLLCAIALHTPPAAVPRGPAVSP